MAGRPSRWPPPEIHGVVALAVAVLVAGGWAATVVLSTFPGTDELTSEAVGMLNTIGGVLAGGVSAYLGAATQRRRQADDDDAGDP